MNQKSRPLVSIIVPTLEASDHIDETVYSLANQSYSNVELIAVDGESDDDTLNRVRQYEESFQSLKIFVNKPSVNQSFARNRGLMHADGKYVIFHDADDLSVPERVKEQVAFLESNPDVGVVGSSFYYLNPNRNEETIRMRPTNHEAIVESLGRSCPIHIGSAMFRREALAETHLFQSKYAEVYEILIDLVTKGWKLRNLEKPLFVYRINEDSISRNGEWSQKLILIKRNYQAVTRLDLPVWNLVLSLGWLIYLYSPTRVKHLIRRIFAPTEDESMGQRDLERIYRLIREEK